MGYANGQNPQFSIVGFRIYIAKKVQKPIKWRSGYEVKIWHLFQ